MTLGNDPQPLTRRQLRELARENEPTSAEASVAEPTAAKPKESPAATFTADKSTAGKSAAGKSAAGKSAAADASSVEPHHSRHTSPPVDADASDRAPAARPAAVKLESAKPEARRPEPAKTAAAPAPLPIPGTVAAAETGRTLSRRELRALQAASSASTDVEVPGQEPVAPTPVSAPRSAPVDDPRQQPVPAPAVHELHPPIGHWSVDREDDRQVDTTGRSGDATFDDLVGRGVGAGGIPTTSNALILPAIPRQGPSGPITSTGEIMITGSIDLPRSLGATGQHPNLFDSSEMDRMLDQLDEGGHHNDVAPVSASRAVSTHTSTRGVMTPPRKRGASLPAVLAITAAVLAIGVLSLFVVGYALNIY